MENDPGFVQFLVLLIMSLCLYGVMTLTSIANTLQEILKVLKTQNLQKQEGE